MKTLGLQPAPNEPDVLIGDRIQSRSSCVCCDSYYFVGGNLHQVVVIRREKSAEEVKATALAVVRALTPAEHLPEITKDALRKFTDFQWDLPSGDVYHIHIEVSQSGRTGGDVYAWATKVR